MRAWSVGFLPSVYSPLYFVLFLFVSRFSIHTISVRSRAKKNRQYRHSSSRLKASMTYQHIDSAPSRGRLNQTRILNTQSTRPALVEARFRLVSLCENWTVQCRVSNRYRNDDDDDVVVGLIVPFSTLLRNPYH